MTTEQRVDSIAKWSNTGMRGAVIEMLEEALAEQATVLNEKLKMATNALVMIAKYAPTRPAAELGLSPQADASWAQQAGSMAKSTLEEIAKKDSGANNE